MGVLMQFAQLVAQQQGVVALLAMAECFHEVAIVAAESVVGGQPYESQRILHHADDIVAGQTVGGVEFAMFQFYGCQPCHALQHEA